MALISPSVLAGGDYRHTVMAQSGQAGLTGIKSAPSINDLGSIAFIGQDINGDQLYWGDGKTLANLSANHSNHTFSTTLQINNSCNIVARDTGSSNTFYLRLWQATSPGSFTVVDSTVGLRQSYCAGGSLAGQPCESSTNCFDFNDPDPTNFFDCVQPPQSHYVSLLFPTLNNNNETAYIGGLTGSLTNAVALLGRQGTYEYPLPSNFKNLREPQLSDAGRVVARAGASSSSPIWMFERNLWAVVEIASQASGFSTLGQMPGISDDGSIIAFVGDRGSGPGVFISFVGLNGTLVRLNIAGENAAVPKPELGELSPTAPLFFTSVDLVSRVSVKSLSPGTNGLENTEVLVAFVATPNLGGTNIHLGSQALTFSSAPGIWTLRGFLRRSGDALAFVRENVYPVVQIGDSVGPGGTLAVESLSVNDPLATITKSPTGLAAHYLAFRISSGTTQAVVRSKATVRPILTGYLAPGILTLSWSKDDPSFVLEESPSPIGLWSLVPNQTNPFVVDPSSPSATGAFFRLRSL
jgi:hypothetical protein